MLVEVHDEAELQRAVAIGRADWRKQSRFENIQGGPATTERLAENLFQMPGPELKSRACLLQRAASIRARMSSGWPNAARAQFWLVSHWCATAGSPARCMICFFDK